MSEVKGYYVDQNGEQQDPRLLDHLQVLDAGDDIIEDLPPPLSKAELKRMMAREHNRAYNAGETTRKPDLTEIVRQTVAGFQEAIDKNPRNKKKRWS